jgi:integrase
MEDLTARFHQWHLPNVSPRTRELYELELRLRITPFFLFQKLSEIDEPMLEAFKAKVAGEVGPKTANSTLSLLGLMLGKAVRWKMLQESPYALERLPEPVKPYQWWSEREDIDRFLKAAETSRYYALYRTALETGLRLGELLGLSKKDINLETKMIHVHRQWTPKRCYGQPKGKRERWVSFHPDLGPVLKKAAETSLHPEALFSTATGKRPGRNKVALKYFRRICRKAGVPRVTFHALRHTFASHFMREHGDIWALKDILGHSAVATTQRYAHHAKRQRLPSLSFSRSPTQESHTLPAVMEVTEKNDRGKSRMGAHRFEETTPRFLKTA